jgi:hypothetical protein
MIPGRCPLALALAAWLAGCATSTGGEQVGIQAVARALAPVGELDGAPAVRWRPAGADADVALTTAEIVVGPLYLWSLPPDLDDGSWARGLWPVAVAHADDQINAGRLVGEVPYQARLDLLSGAPAPIGSGTAIAGAAASAELWLEPSGSSPSMIVEGVVLHDPEPLRFRAAITWASPWFDEENGVNAVLLRRLRGMPTDLALREGLVIEIGVDARAWIDARFIASLADVQPGEDGVRRPGPSDVAGRALDAGVRRIGPAGPWRIVEASPD